MQGGNIENYQIKSVFSSPEQINPSRVLQDTSNFHHNDLSTPIQSKSNIPEFNAQSPIERAPYSPQFRPVSPEGVNRLPIIFNTTQRTSRDVSPCIIGTRLNTLPIVFNHPVSFVNSPLNSQIRFNNAVTASPIQVMNPTNSEFVTRIQYDRCISECKNWETRYNELYLRHMNSNNAHQYDYQAKEENHRLRRRIQQLEEREKANLLGFQMKLANLMENCRENLMKQCMILVDRHRLECQYADS